MNQNVEVVQQVFAAFGRGDVPTILQYQDPQVQWIFPGEPDIPFAGSGRGHAIVERHFAQVFASIEPLQFDVSRILAADDMVVAIVRVRAKARSTGRIYDVEMAMVFTLDRRRVERLQVFYDTRAVAAAFNPNAT